MHISFGGKAYFANMHHTTCSFQSDAILSYIFIILTVFVDEDKTDNSLLHSIELYGIFEISDPPMSPHCLNEYTMTATEATSDMTESTNQRIADICGSHLIDVVDASQGLLDIGSRVRYMCVIHFDMHEINF